MKCSLIFASLSLALLVSGRGLANPAGSYSAVTQVGHEQSSEPRFTAASVSLRDDTAPVSPLSHDSHAAASSCGDCGECASCVAVDCCQECCWMHDYMVWGEVLLLRARNTDVAYAVETNNVLPGGPGNPVGVQTGPVGVVDQEYEAGFRVGFGVAFDDFSSISAQYTFFETDGRDDVTANNFVLAELVRHPATLGAAVPHQDARARHDIDFDLVDVDYRHIFKLGDTYALNWLAGARYAHLEQDFQAVFTSIGQTTIDSRLTFDGGGIRVGLEGERVGRRGFLIYGRSAASFVGGEFRGTFRQQDIPNLNEVETEWSGTRLVSILDLELGLGWYSKNGRWRLSGGYLVSGWFNTVKTDEFIESIQTNDFSELGHALSFDGFTGRVEYRF